jgi:MarR family 2-MHQ and catechol resistance regulon transcriptional repressor
MPTHFKGDANTTQALDTYIKFTRSANAFESRLFQRAVLEDLTATQFGVLETLYHMGSLCQGELSGKLLKSTGNITLVLDNLEKLGLVRRERDTEDRRMVFLHLTPAGEELIARVFPRVAEAICSEMSVLSSEEQAQLGSLCRKLGKKSSE